MITRVERRSIAGVDVINVVLAAEVGPLDDGPIASALFGLAECAHLRGDFLSDGCRGVTADRLNQVLAHGIDVFPTNAPIWVSSLSKAMEYGEWPKIILVLDVAQLDQTFRELPITSSKAERAELRREFPTELISEDGSHVWLSRLPATDRRATTGYEVAFGRWIPGDAHAALLAVVVVQHPGHALIDLNEIDPAFNET